MTNTTQVYGLHAVESVFENQQEQIISLTVADGRDDKKIRNLVDKAKAAGIPVATLSRKELDQLLSGARHQGVLADITQPKSGRSEKDLPAFLASLHGPAFLLVLDGVQDPHNLGACLRSADAAGVNAVIIPRDKSVGITSVVRKVASGAAEAVPVFSVTNLSRTLRLLKEAGIWLYGASDDADHGLFDTDLRGPIALVLGSEGKGLRRLTAELCDFQVSIPMAGQVESLNVSVAAGVLLYEVVRQRMQAG